MNDLIDVVEGAAFEFGAVKGTVKAAEALTDTVRIVSAEFAGRRLAFAVATEFGTDKAAPFTDCIDIRTARAIARHVLSGGEWHGSSEVLVNTLALGIVAFLPEDGTPS